MMHNEKIKIFDDVLRHLLLEAEHLKAAKSKNLVYMVKSGSWKTSRPKSNKSKIGIAVGHVKKGLETSHGSKRGKHEKNKSKLKCFNCEK